MKFLKKFPETEVCKGVTVEEIDLSNISSFKSSIFIVDPGSISTLDFHEVKECWIVMSGEGVLSVNNEQTKIKEKDVIYFEPFDKHFVKNEGSMPLKMVSIWW